MLELWGLYIAAVIGMGVTDAECTNRINAFVAYYDIQIVESMHTPEQGICTVFMDKPNAEKFVKELTRESYIRPSSRRKI